MAKHDRAWLSHQGFQFYSKANMFFFRSYAASFSEMRVLFKAVMRGRIRSSFSELVIVRSQLSTANNVRRNSLDKELLLRHVRGDLIVVACKACALTEEMVRNAVVKRHGASTPMRTLRRRMGLGCSRMNSADGVDRCELRISGELLIDAD